MFMLILHKDEVVSRAVTIPLNVTTLKGRPMRSRPQWMEAMNLKAVQLKVRYYAFRYRGEWHLCEAFGHHTPLRSYPAAEGQDGAETWVFYRERGDAKPH